MANDSNKHALAQQYAASLRLRTRTALAGDIKALTDSYNRKDKAMLNSIEKTRVAGLGEALQEERRLAQTGRLLWPNMPETPEEAGLAYQGMQFDESQTAAIDRLMHYKYGILIGAAGTGKTTLVKQVISNFIYGTDGRYDQLGLRNLGGAQGPSIAVCAFTGVATGVLKATLPEWLHPCVKTIHSLLEYKPASMEGGGDSSYFVPTRNAENLMDYDLIVLDEASMVGLNLWHNIVDALRPTTRVILLGDLNQLAPVADTPFFPYVLADAMADNGAWTVAELTTVHRQSGVGGNRILDTAHAVLSGKIPEFDELAPGKPWHVINVPLPAKAEDAHTKIIATLNQLRSMRAIGEDGEPEPNPIYNPYSDLVLTTGNGWMPDDLGAAVMQSPLNESLSRFIVPDSEDTPVYVIDAVRSVKQYAVGDRIMCTSNEAPGTEGRVTNGTLGVIKSIEPNPAWSGDLMKFGTKAETRRRQVEKLNADMNRSGKTADEVDSDHYLQSAMEYLASGNFELTQPKERERIQPSSHIIVVEYRNGSTRKYTSASDVDSTQLAYALTTHKAQGSQADIVFIVCHSAAKHQLNREWLYTGITRAKSKLVIFSNDLGLRTAISKQQIFGKTLREKVERYLSMTSRGNRFVRLVP